jgi:hypothetical protein
MFMFSKAVSRFRATDPRTRRTLRRVSLAFAIFALTGLLWRPIIKHVNDPLMSGILIGALMLSMIASAVRGFRPRR